MVPEQLAPEAGGARDITVEPAARGGGMPALALVRAGVALDRSDRCGQFRPGRLSAAQDERCGAQAVAHGKCRITLYRPLDVWQCASIGAEKTCHRSLEALERDRVVARRELS